MGRRVGTLSGGERQRVAIARALATAPELLLMDEPLAALDAPRRGEALRLIERIRARFALPILYVTHALDEVDRLAERLVLLEEGRVLASGTPEELALRPDLPLAPRRVMPHDPAGQQHAGIAARGTTRIALAEGSLDILLRSEPVGQMLRLRLRARDVAICTGGGALPLGHAALPVQVVRLDSPQPGEALVTLGAGELRLLARLPLGEAAALVSGQAVRALIPRTALDHGAGG
jgi:molybdate transport system ATP-binding protein